MRRLTPLAALLTACLLPTGAQASEHVPLTHAAPATRVQADALLRTAVLVADRANTARGHRATSPAEVFVYDATDGLAARADTPGNRVYIDRGYRDATWTQTNDRYLPRAYRVWLLSGLCELLAHERLHNLGLGHVADPRSPLAADSFERPRPTVCVAWAKRMVPVRRARTLRKRTSKFESAR